MLGVKWRSDHLFPWKIMVSELAKASVMIFNWPEGCRHPSKTPKESNKGIVELSAPEQTALMDALVHPRDRLYFLLVDTPEKRKGKLMLLIDPLAPVLI
jgi:hypothetical protein